MKYYRLIYKGGSHGAWTRDYAWIAECAKFFGATIETKIFSVENAEKMLDKVSKA